jgi:hypothetical protein
MERNLPATQEDTAPDDHPERPMEPPRRPVSVAFLPLALIVYVVLAFTIAAWTFLHAAF